MSKEAVFTMKLEPELRAEFMAEAAGEDRPASQVMRELMRYKLSTVRAGDVVVVIMTMKLNDTQDHRQSGEPVPSCSLNRGRPGRKRKPPRLRASARDPVRCRQQTYRSSRRFQRQ